MRNLTTLTLLIVTVKTYSVAYAVSQMCFDCRSIPYPRDCDKVVSCGPDSECYVEEFVNAAGTILYNTGCRSVSRCALNRREVIEHGNDVKDVADLDDDVTLCEMCCDGDYCNSNGCNSKPLAPVDTRGPVCFNCHQQQREDTCFSVKVCDLNEQCLVRAYVTGNNDLLYTTECMSSVVCDQLFGVDVAAVGRRDLPVCTGCCRHDFCNRNCSALQHHHATDWSSTATTGPSGSTTGAPSPTVNVPSPTSTRSPTAGTTSSTANFPSSTTPRQATSAAISLSSTTGAGTSTESTSSTGTSTTATVTHSSTTSVVTSQTSSPTISPDEVCRDKGYQFDSVDRVCYKIFHDRTLSWYNSRKKCRQDGGDLIVFRSKAEEMQFVTYTKGLLAQTRGQLNYWVGASDDKIEGHWVWVDGSTVDTGYFQDHQPDDHYNNEDCAALNKPNYMFFPFGRNPGVLLNDANCDMLEYFICEIVLQHLEPPQPTVTPCRNADYTYNAETGTCYKIYDHVTLDQHDARKHCQGETADLLVLRNRTVESVFINMHFNDKNTMHRYWLGAQRIPGHYRNVPESFEWINGRPLDHSLRWYPAEPNNDRGQEDCLSFTYFPAHLREPVAEFALNDDKCFDSYYFICEERCPNNTYQYDAAHGLCYKLFTDNVTWGEASKICEQDKMDLLEIKDDTEFQYFQGILKGNVSYWVGARDTTASGLFEWLTLKQRVPASFWHSASVSAEQKGKHCCSLSHSAADNKVALVHQDCDTNTNVHGFICQHIW